MNILKKIKPILLNFSFGLVSMFLVFFPWRAEAKIPSIEIIYGKQKWHFDPNKNLEAIFFEENNFLHLKNTNIKLPIIIDNKNLDFEQNLNLELIHFQQIRLDTHKMEQYLNDKIIKKIEKPARDAQIYTDKNKKIIIEGKGEDGLKVNRNGLIAGIELAINNESASPVKIPIVEQKAKVEIAADLQELGIKTLIATGHSSFTGSPSGRVHNIKIGTSRYNGILIKPGEIFEFNKHLGPVDKKHDFAEALVIKPEGTIQEYGGGLCQVSSTLFRAALDGGFPIVERAPHSYAVSYYAQVGGYGLDATVYPGARDIKFLNDSPGHILIQAYVEDEHAYFKFYGTDDTRKTSLEGPFISNKRSAAPTEIIETDKLPVGVKKQVEKSHNGFDVTWYRYIEKNGMRSKETIFSRYNAVPAKILVGRTRNI